MASPASPPLADLAAAESLSASTTQVFDMYDLVRHVALRVVGLRDLASFSAVSRTSSLAALPLLRFRLGPTWDRAYLRRSWSRELACR